MFCLGNSLQMQFSLPRWSRLHRSIRPRQKNYTARYGEQKRRISP